MQRPHSQSHCFHSSVHTENAASTLTLSLFALQYPFRHYSDHTNEVTVFTTRIRSDTAASTQRHSPRRDILTAASTLKNPCFHSSVHLDFVASMLTLHDPRERSHYFHCSVHADNAMSMGTLQCSCRPCHNLTR